MNIKNSEYFIYNQINSIRSLLENNHTIIQYRIDVSKNATKIIRWTVTGKQSHNNSI